MALPSFQTSNLFFVPMYLASSSSEFAAFEAEIFKLERNLCCHWNVQALEELQVSIPVQQPKLWHNERNLMPSEIFSIVNSILQFQTERKHDFCHSSP